MNILSLFFIVCVLHSLLSKNSFKISGPHSFILGRTGDLDFPHLSSQFIFMFAKTARTF